MRTRNVNGVHAPTAAYAGRPAGRKTLTADLAGMPAPAPETLCSVLRDLAVMANLWFLGVAFVPFVFLTIGLLGLGLVIVGPVLLPPVINIAAMSRSRHLVWAGAAAALANVAWLGLLWGWVLMMDGGQFYEALELGALLAPQELALAVQLAMLYVQARRRFGGGESRPMDDAYRVEGALPACLWLAALLLATGLAAFLPWRSPEGIRMSIGERFAARTAQGVARISCSLNSNKLPLDGELECTYESPRKEVIRDVRVDAPPWLGHRVASVLYVRDGGVSLELADGPNGKASMLDAFFLDMLAERILDRQP